MTPTPQPPADPTKAQETPRTDAYARQLASLGGQFDSHTFFEIARQLERELAAMTKERDEAQGKLGGAVLFGQLGGRLITRIMESADMSLPDATDVELQLVRLLSQLAASRAEVERLQVALGKEHDQQAEVRDELAIRNRELRETCDKLDALRSRLTLAEEDLAHFTGVNATLGDKNDELQAVVDRLTHLTGPARAKEVSLLQTKLTLAEQDAERLAGALATARSDLASCGEWYGEGPPNVDKELAAIDAALAAARAKETPL